MTEQEITMLRTKCRSFEKQTQRLETAKSRLQSQLAFLQTSLTSKYVGRSLKIPTRQDPNNVTLNIKEKYSIEKWGSISAERLLQLRLQCDLRQIRKGHPPPSNNGNKDVRSESNFLLWTHGVGHSDEEGSKLPNNYFASNAIEQQTIVTNREQSFKYRQSNSSFLLPTLKIKENRPQSEKIVSVDKRALRKRAKKPELIDRGISINCKIDKNVVGSGRKNQSGEQSSTSYSFQSSQQKGFKLGAKEFAKNSGGPVRCKAQRSYRCFSNPYDFGKGRLTYNVSPISRMDAFTLTHIKDNQPSYPLGPVVNDFHHAYFQRSIGSGLETLPEASSEEESLVTVKDDSLSGHVSGIPRDTSPLSRQCRSMNSLDCSFELESGSTSASQHHHHHHRSSSSCSSSSSGRRLKEFILADDEYDKETHKAFLLESIIQQLKDELRECKDQNELLEFRLLEIEESGSAIKQGDEEPDACRIGKAETPPIPIPELPSHDECHQSGHSAVTESRSSCGSDCSESLSLQESGIFDGQGSDDGLPSPKWTRSHNVSRELANLTFQIEELLKRYNEGPDSNSKFDAEKRLSTPERGKVDLASDLGYCRQRVQEFEKRLSQMNDISYIRSLEDRVNFLLVDNKRLEEERSEIEEAENDNRYLCQRLEEKVRQLKKKKLAIRCKLEEEKTGIEDLREEMVHLQTKNLKETSKVSQLEGLVQTYEQKNFELEESYIEMRCSVQFVVTTMPIISSLYCWFYLCYWRKILLNYLANVQTRITASQLPAIGFVRRKVTRKHKLSEILEGVEPINKKCRNADIMKIRIRNPTTCHPFAKDRISLSQYDANHDMDVDMDVEVEAGEGESLSTGLSPDPYSCSADWENAALSLREKIEALENGITKAQEKFELERVQLIEMYEEKLGDKETELKQSRQWQNENQELQEKWNCLIQELEQFAIYVGRNLHEKCEGMPGLEDWDQLPLFLKAPNRGEMRQNKSEGENEMEMITATRVDNNNADRVTTIGMDVKRRVIPLLQSTLKEHFARFEWREQQLLSEIDRLMLEIKANRGCRIGGVDGGHVDDNMVTHLMDENQRLHALLKDHDKAWSDLKHAQDENERLRSELSEIKPMQKRLEEAQRNEVELRERLEEVERVESGLRSQLDLIERKEQKGMEKIQQLREELQFLRNKCCQLQDDVDARVSRENKYKSEIQLLIAQLRESKTSLEEKEAELETKESVLQNQIYKLKAQLEELLQTFNDTECCNGMLREEISYLEKTVEEAVGKNAKNESTIASLSHELKQKDSLIEDLQSQLRQLRIVESQPTSINSPHELSDFNNSEGGFHGVVRAVQEAVGLIKSCSRCESVGSKLMEIADALIPLIQTIQSSQTTDFCFSEEPEYVMARCESDEILIPPPAASPVKMAGKDRSSSRFPEQFAEEDDEILITRLQSTMSRLTMQITKLEENLNIKQTEVKKSHGIEVGLWKSRCEEKNLLIELLARRLSHLSATDVEGHFINGILTEVRKIETDFLNNEAPEPSSNAQDTSTILWQRKQKGPVKDFSFTTLRAFLTSERRRILELLECVSVGTREKNSVGDNNGVGAGDMGFRVVRKIGDDALLVSWTVPETGCGTTIAGACADVMEGTSSTGYEIAVNGLTYLRIPQKNRHKAVLFGLNLLEPVKLSFKCPGNPNVEESTIIFIS